MMKRRRTGKRAAQEARLNTLWGELIHLQGGGRCIICGRGGEDLHAAHLVGKGANVFLRWEPENGVLMCSAHHAAYDGQAGPAAMIDTGKRFAAKCPDKVEWIVENRGAGRRRLPDLDDVESELMGLIEEGTK